MGTSMIEKVVKKSRLDEGSEIRDLVHWLSVSPRERVEAVEELGS